MDRITNSRAHAVVMGASMAGLLAARTLSDHFERVTFIERDALKAEAHDRKGVPQAEHIHVLLARGYRILSKLIPNFRESVLAEGGIVGDVRELIHFYQHDYWPEFRSGIEVVFISRPALEAIVRWAVKHLPNVTFVEETSVESLAATPDKARVTGVQMHHHNATQTETLLADLVVDTTGRGSRTPQWLGVLGYEAPAESAVRSDVVYASQLYRRDVSNDAARTYYSVPVAPHLTRGAVVMPIEGNRWIVTQIGYFGAQPSTDSTGFIEATRDLPVPDIYDLLKTSAPMSDLLVYRFAASKRRFYEKLKRFPCGFIVVGDAVSSFNPAYGQGMTVAAMEAEALDEWLKANDADPLTFFKQIAKVVDVPWQLATGSDFAFPQTTGEKALSTNVLNAYTARYYRAAAHDPALTQAFFEVAHLIAPPTLLFKPRIVARVLLGKTNGHDNHWKAA